MYGGGAHPPKTFPPQVYAMGTGDASACNSEVPLAPAAVDAQFWNLLSGVDPEASN